MKKETLYEALGDIKDSYIRDAHAVQKKKTALLSWVGCIISLSMSRFEKAI